MNKLMIFKKMFAITLKINIPPLNKKGNKN